MTKALASAILLLLGAASYLGINHPLVALGLLALSAALLVVLIIWG